MDAKQKYKLKSRRERRTRARALNAMSSPSGAGSSCDRGAGWGQQPARNFTELCKQLSRWYYNNWAARKGIDIPVQDMLREPWKYTGLTKPQQEQLETAQDKLDLVNVLGQALRLERLLGGSVILMGVAGTKDDASEPLVPESVQQGDLKFLNVIPRNRITQTRFSNDPLAANFGRPESYFVNGVEIHRSRLLIFDGNPIAPNNLLDCAGDNRRRNDGFGDSVLEGVLDDLTYATGARQSAFHLINQASIWLLETDLLTLQETKQGDARINELEKIGEQISMFKAAIMDNGGDSRSGSALSSVSPSFGSVPELMMSYLQVLSGAFDIAATRYMGQAPGGLNATGESDLENYYNQIDAKQRQHLRPEIMKLLPVLMNSTFGPGEVGEVKVDVEFEPLWNLSETDESTIRTNDATMLATLFQTGAVSSTEVEAEARERKLLIAEPVDIARTEVGDDAAPDLLGQLQRLADESMAGAVPAPASEAGIPDQV